MIQTIKNSLFFKAISNKFPVYFVGGCVRDYFLSLDPKDVDLIVCHTNIEVLIEELKKFGKLDLVGKSFGVIKFKPFELKLDEPIDIALPRVEVCTGIKHTDFKVVSNESITLEEDLIRRDFTINSLALDSNLNLVDPFNGLQDLKNKVIKMTNPQAFKDDSLRLLRAIRFSCKLDFSIDVPTWEEVLKGSIKHISEERIRIELEKILISKHPGKGIRLLVESQLLRDILPELYLLKGMDQGTHHRLDGLDHTIEVVEGVESTVMMRMAAFLHDIGKPADRIVNETGVHFYGHEDTSAKIADDFLRKMKFSNPQRELIVLLIKEHMSILKGEQSMKSARRVRMRVGEDMFKMILDHTESDLKASLGQGLDWVDTLRKAEFKEKSLDKLPVTGKDIMTEFSLKQGPEVGRLLDRVRELISDDPTLTKEAILTLLKS